MLFQPGSGVLGRRGRVVVLLLVLAGAVVGGALLVRQMSERRAARVASLPSLMVPGDTVGPVRLGMTRQQVTAALGEPYSIEAGGRTWQYRDPGIAILWGRDEPPTVGAVLAGGHEKLSNVPFRTAEGIGLGSTADELRAAWGQPDAGSSGETMNYGSRGMQFMLRDGRVVWFAVRKPTAAITRPR